MYMQTTTAHEASSETPFWKQLFLFSWIKRNGPTAIDEAKEQLAHSSLKLLTFIERREALIKEIDEKVEDLQGFKDAYLEEVKEAKALWRGVHSLRTEIDKN